jgi:predicted ATPase
VTDFFISRANEGVRVVIESHSEHVLLRLRRRIAEGKLNADEVAIYFVDNIDGATQLRRISLGEKAELDREEWPAGFFEDQLEDSFALATAQAFSRANDVDR